MEGYLRRGGGVVVVHDAVCGADPHWFKTVVGGAWEHRHSKWLEGNVGFYIVDPAHPITKGVSNFEIDDEIYYDLHLEPEAHVLATSFHSVHVIAPQMWTYEKSLAGGKGYRAFVSILGHKYSTFEAPHTRALLLRGIAWAGKRDADLLLDEEEKGSLRYAEGGPTEPAEAVGQIVVHPEFTVNLVASEPLITKPISVDWDPAGRLWVAETPEYPNGRRVNASDAIIAPWRKTEPGLVKGGVEDRPARDRVSYLEDTDQDGVMDKKTVFFEGLELVTSLVFYRDGVIVAQAPDILWLRDTDGDGRADKTEKMYTGFGTGDTHAVVSNLRWGLDGWVYGTVGYSRGNIYSGDGRRHFGPVTEGVLRFRPDGSAFEQVSSKGSNTWGMDVDWDGEIYFTQATSGHHLNHVVLPEKILARSRVEATPSYFTTEDHKKSYPLMSWTKQAYVQIDVVGGFTAVSGSCLYTGGAWPQKYNGTHFCAEPTINIVHHDVLKPNGVTFKASREAGREESEFIGSRDLWFRPIHVRVGPDGALYVVDFYNQAVVHNDTRGPRHGANNAATRPDRDHYFGRIWRVQHKEAEVFGRINLAEASAAELIKALEHPNMWVRQTAHRLLSERGDKTVAPALAELYQTSASAAARVHGLWVRHNLGLEGDRLVVEAAASASEPAIRRNALRIMAEEKEEGGRKEEGLERAVRALLRGTDARARLLALSVLSSAAVEIETARLIVGIYGELEDGWSRAAALAVASQAPLFFLEAALAEGSGKGGVEMAGQVGKLIGGNQEAELALRGVERVAGRAGSAAEAARVFLENLVASLKPEVRPAWSEAVERTLRDLLGSGSSSVSGAALPLVARWDTDRALRVDVARLVAQCRKEMSDASQPDEARGRLAVLLLNARDVDGEALEAVVALLRPGTSAGLQQRLIEALGGVPDLAAGQALAASYPSLSPQLRELAFAQLVKRVEWANAFLDALKAQKIPLGSLTPTAVHQLRTHGDRATAQRAVQVFEELRGPEAKEKEGLIAQFTPAVQHPGNIAKGKELFTANCATCHKLGNEGRDLAPDLTGMGAHGPVELLPHILDPNRYVEANYMAWSFETKDGEVVDGIIARENRSSVVVRTAQGDIELPVGNIASRRNSGLSLMPNGFEALGEEGLRDLLAYLCGGETRYRLLDLSKAFTADSTRGIFTTVESSGETLRFAKFGLTRVEEIPFDVVNPLRTATGRNLIVLKGRNGMARSYPQRVEIAAGGIVAKRLHFLGGVGGWAYPFGGDPQNNGMAVVKVVVQYTQGQQEELILKNGVEFADYIGAFDVAGSKEAPNLVRSGQVRWFSKQLNQTGSIDRLILESYNTLVAPVFVAITAELAPATTLTPVGASLGPGATGIRTLIVGGGSSHDFDRWFNGADTATLVADGLAAVSYTARPGAVGSVLPNLDVLFLSNNQPLSDPVLRQGIFDFARAGKGLLLVHPALWYNWTDWPEYNRVLAGGGARGHDRLGLFEVKVINPSHPIMQGVPLVFSIMDELYWFEPDTAGTPIEVLATAYSAQKKKTYPQVFVIRHPAARIVGLTLGHDGSAHSHPAYKSLLRNSLKWAGCR